MTYLLNDPVDFAEELVEGFLAANGALVVGVPGGIARASAVPEGQVVVITGGGSGHYPAFAGLVGRGLAHGAVVGNTFASPSAQQVQSVARELHAGAGVLLCYGNYAGDVLNFDRAQERLRAEGIPCRTVVVTDDISSATAAERSRRRGIAGGLFVFKAAAYAAERGLSLDETWEFARRANERTRTLGVAFSGCTLPGAAEPLFTMTKGRMSVGMGIHGEPGISESDVPTADAVAEMLVASLVDERPGAMDGTSEERVAVILNGLGSVKYEELFVLFRSVSRLLRAAGLEVVEPEVGEFFTSFEMAGASLTVAWLDELLERAWRAPAETPGYRKGSLPDTAAQRVPSIRGRAAPREVRRPNDGYAAAPESRAAVPVIVAALESAEAAIDGDVEELGRLDAVAGDGDHGIGMQRGIRAARAAAAAAAAGGAGAGSTIRAAADAWADRAGGTSGALWGLVLEALADAFGDDDPLRSDRVVAAFSTAEARVAAYGGAARGDKTMLDVLGPFADALAAETAAGRGFRDAWRAADEAATRAAEATADLLPRVGRARPHTFKSIGTRDPGAVSMALIIHAVSATLDGED